MASASSSQGWSRKAPPRTMSMAMPVAATPAPMMSVPCASSQMSRRVKRPGFAATTGSPSVPRVRIVKGSRKAGRKSETARTTCVVSRRGKRLGGMVSRPLHVEGHPVGLLVPPDDAQAGRLEGRHDLRLAVDEDARRQQPAAAAGACRRRGAGRRPAPAPEPTSRLATRLARTRSKGPPSTGSEPADAVMVTPVAARHSRAWPRRRWGRCRRRAARGAQQAGRHGQDARARSRRR